MKQTRIGHANQSIKNLNPIPIARGVKMVAIKLPGKHYSLEEQGGEKKPKGREG